jgi:hypothetical protein
MEISRAGAGPGKSGESSECSLNLIVPEETVWQTATEVGRTLVSPAYGAYQPAPMVRCRARVLLPTETATALVPGGGAIRQGSEPLIERRFASMALAAVQVYQLDYHDRRQGFFFALSDKAWSSGPWSSDARLLYCRIEKEKLVHLILIGGTQAAWQGQPLLRAERQSSFFEWRKQDAVINAEPGEFSVTALFEELTGAELTGSSRCSPMGLNPVSSSYAEKH